MPLSKQPMFFNSSRNSPKTSTPATKLGAALVATLLTLLASTLALATSSDDATRVTGIRVDESSEGTRVILELSARAFYSFSNDANSATLALSNAALAAQLPRPRLPADSPITRLEIRSGSKPSISVDFRDGYSASVTALLPNDVHSQRLVLDIRNAYPQQLSLPPATQKSNYYTIVIDPGHGGEDRGASLNGVIEKDVVLAVAQHLRQRLNEIDGVRALITRDRDKSLALLERRMFAAQNQADLFLSLHANSYIQDSRIQGAIVFGLADKGANSAFTRMLVAKENKADEYAALADYEDNNPHISRVLAELALGDNAQQQRSGRQAHPARARQNHQVTLQESATRQFRRAEIGRHTLAADRNGFSVECRRSSAPQQKPRAAALRRSHRPRRAFLFERHQAHPRDPAPGRSPVHPEQHPSTHQQRSRIRRAAKHAQPRPEQLLQIPGQTRRHPQRPGVAARHQPELPAATQRTQLAQTHRRAAAHVYRAFACNR